MNTAFSEDLLLTNETGKHLYNTYAKDLPIVDYHCHLLPEEIRENRVFTDLGEMWLAHDHYKWRAMRTFGIDEKYITGSATYYEKFMAFAKIFPNLIGNPIYIWCALELKRYFGIDEPLSPDNADDIYRRTKQMIDEHKMTPRWCMETSKVEVVCTTDDPIDSLEHHIVFRKQEDAKTRILPAFRPDKALYCEKPTFAKYISKLASAAGVTITSFADVVQALEKRLVFFKTFGTTVSDHGIEEFFWQECSPKETEAIFAKAMAGDKLTREEIDKYRSAFLIAVGELYHRHGFVMQLHIGTYQGANKKGEETIGVACGFDCTDDSSPVQGVGALLNCLTQRDMLPKTILYPLDPAKIETFAVLAAGFCEGGTVAKVQLGAPWWFNDQSFGILRQFEAAANLYPIALSVGMLTDSRSFLSYPRHELYRRVLCSYFGSLVERGEYFSGEKQLGHIIRNICYNNVKHYFGI